MYDDWGNQISIPVEDAFPPPESTRPPEIVPTSRTQLDDIDWLGHLVGAREPTGIGNGLLLRHEAGVQDRVSTGGFALSVLDDAFVLPATEGAGTSGVKPGSDDDWLTPLSNEDVADLGEIVVVGFRPDTHGNGSDNGSDGHDTDPQGNGHVFDGSDGTSCEFFDEVDFVEPIGYDVPDGAQYYAPENFDQDFLNNVIAHLISFSNVIGGATREVFGLPVPISDRIAEFERLYTDVNHPYFLDFKDLPGPTVFSFALNREIEASAFEPFGNFVYGLVGSIVGIDSTILRGAAWYFQEGGTGAEDGPHIDLGIQAGERYKTHGTAAIGVDERGCGDE